MAGIRPHSGARPNRADLLEVSQHPSPNFGPRRGGLTPHLIVLHFTAMESAEAALHRLCDPEAEVSAHYLITVDGAVTQMVSEDQRAWHAGAGSWHGQDDINSRSIGIELDNTSLHPFPEPQMKALEGLLRAIMARWDIGPAGVIGHSDMAPGRKADPGAHFDWARLARQGLAVPPGATDEVLVSTPAEFREAARRAGYTAPCSDAELLHSVRLRYRSYAKGPLCAEDFSVLGQAALRA